MTQKLQSDSPVMSPEPRCLFTLTTAETYEHATAVEHVLEVREKGAFQRTVGDMTPTVRCIIGDTIPCKCQKL